MAAEQILLVNPRRRRRRKSATARRRVRRKNPRVSRVRRRRIKRAAGYVVGARRIRRRKLNPRVRRRRRNPRLGGLGIPSVKGIIGQIVPAATGAVGAVGLDIALAYLPIPDQYKTGWLGTGVKVAGAIGLGVLAGKVVGRQRGQLFTAGALTVIAYQVIRKLAKDTLGDNVKGLSGVADFTDLQLGPRISGLGAYMRPALPAPAGSQMNGLGAYMNPAGILQGMEGGYSGGDSGYYGY